MLAFFEVEADLYGLHRDDPLYVGNHFDLTGMWWSKRKQRQALILSIAFSWYSMTRRQKKAPGFLKEEILLSSLTCKVREARSIIEHFFNIDQLGFNFGGENKSPTIISPKRLSKKYVDSIERLKGVVKFYPGPEPTASELTISQVQLTPENRKMILDKLESVGRDDLMPAVMWLYDQPGKITFYHRAAGKLKARDTSVWPVKAIETWPSWLREELFGTTIDLENAFCQFLSQQLESKYAEKPELLELKYPDIMSANRDKQRYREELCKSVLKLPPEDKNIKCIKQLIMALANGSNASPLLMVNGASRSEAARIVREANPGLSDDDLMDAGRRLQKIARQFRNAKRSMCMFLLKEKPTRLAQRKIFSLYFEWERKARYAIWEAIGKTGLHLHDGIDGVITDMTEEELIYHIARKTSLRVSVEKPKELIQL